MYMKNLLKKFSSLLQDGSGDSAWSTTRFAFLFTVIISNVVIFGVWVAICYHKREIVPIPSEIVTLYSLANGITAASKVIQKRFESNNTNASDSQSVVPSQPVGDA
jgi:hypothetical protein